MNNQEMTTTQAVKDILQDLEPEEAAQIMTNILEGLGYVVKRYHRDDIVSNMDNDFRFDNFADEDRSRIVDYALDSSYFSDLGDSTDNDSELIYQAIDEGYTQWVQAAGATRLRVDLTE